MAVNLRDIDLTLPKNRIQEDIVLPKGRGKAVKVTVIGGGELALKAKDVADLVIGPDEIGALADNKKQAKKVANDTEFFIAEAPLMAQVGKRLGTVLGPRGKMPKPIAPGADPSAMIDNLRKSVTVRTKDHKTFHVPVGTVEMSAEDIAENIDVVMSRVIGHLEKGKHNIDSVYIKTSMGPSERLM
ncbi:LSU ribosomal protein L1P [Thermoplasmatales archaeon BRNA1]|nr:LSU ribosomal protein L1P [Thermoplasmatales archaeon BRNA1]